MHFSKIRVTVLFLTVTLQFETGVAQISPGELSLPHAGLEGISSCKRCHDREQGLSGDRCLDCHGEITIQLEEKRGFHKQKNCGDCHAEHNGREYELIYWENGIDAFDHNQTGFILKGKHAVKKCRDCHRRDFIVMALKDLNPDLNLDRTFLGLARKCASCHRDVHRAQFNRGCPECHGVESWRPAVHFDHSRTRYTLSGKHISIPCEKCHQQVAEEEKREGSSDYVRYVGLQYDDCSTCHEYRHKSELGKRCDGCHMTEGWEAVGNRSFDHAKTRFPLRGRHGKIKCELCHREGSLKSPLEFERCTGCHRDVHLKGFRSERYAGECGQCHRDDSFVPSSFGLTEHDRSTYPLTGAHRAIPCSSCHRNDPETDLISFRIESRTCSSCHSDRHFGQFSNRGAYEGCDSCHSTSRWDSLEFDHQKTGFPLDGRHVDVKCADCHPRVRANNGEEYIKYTPLDRSCRACHGGDSEELFERESVE